MFSITWDMVRGQTAIGFWGTSGENFGSYSKRNLPLTLLENVVRPIIPSCLSEFCQTYVQLTM